MGDSLRAGIINGPLGIAVVCRIDRDELVVEFEPDVDGNAPGDPFPSRTVSLILGHPRPIVLRRLLRDLATVGVDRLIVVPTDLGEKSYLKATVWTDIRPRLIEGASQAGTTTLMEVIRSDSLAAGVQLAAGETGGQRIVLDIGAPTAVDRVLKTDEPIVLAVGSERGWTPDELSLLNDAGFISAALGARVLRTETAAAIGCWMARNASGTGFRP